MKDYKTDIAELQSKPHIRPTDTVLAFAEEVPINFVITEAHLRFKITKQISRDQFMETLRFNLAHRNGVAAKGEFEGSKVDIESAENQPEPGPEFKYFYEAEAI